MDAGADIDDHGENLLRARRGRATARPRQFRQLSPRGVPLLTSARQACPKAAILAAGSNPADRSGRAAHGNIMASDKNYDESSFRVLKGLEPVRERPGMYTRTDSPAHIIREVIDNAADEGAGRLCQEDPCDPAQRRFGHGGRRRPRHPGGAAPGREGAGGGASLYPAARRRQVRQKEGNSRLCLLGRPARRRRGGDQCAVDPHRGRGQARGAGSTASISPTAARPSARSA